MPEHETKPMKPWTGTVYVTRRHPARILSSDGCYTECSAIQLALKLSDCGRRDTVIETEAVQDA